MSEFKGKTVIVVNAASKCGLTPQYEGLEKHYREYKDNGLVVLGFPCNQFANQESGSAGEIEEFCQVNYGVTFPMFAKVDVNGYGAHPLFKYLKNESGSLFGSKVKWNFTKEVLYLENQICFPLYAASRLTNQLYTPLLNEMGLTYPQYLVMLVLWQYKEKTVNEICSMLILETNTVTPLLKRLEQKELIVRSRSMEDERIVIVSLSDKGVDLREAALLIPSKIISNLNGKDISLEELLAFKETIWKLLGVLKTK